MKINQFIFFLFLFFLSFLIKTNYFLFKFSDETLDSEPAFISNCTNYWLGEHARDGFFWHFFYLLSFLQVQLYLAKFGINISFFPLILPSSKFHQIYFFYIHNIYYKLYKTSLYTFLIDEKIGWVCRQRQRKKYSEVNSKSRFRWRETATESKSLLLLRNIDS